MVIPKTWLKLLYVVWRERPIARVFYQRRKERLVILTWTNKSNWLRNKQLCFYHYHHLRHRLYRTNNNSIVSIEPAVQILSYVNIRNYKGHAFCHLYFAIVIFCPKNFSQGWPRFLCVLNLFSFGVKVTEQLTFHTIHFCQMFFRSRDRRARDLGY